MAWDEAKGSGIFTTKVENLNAKVCVFQRKAWEVMLKKPGDLSLRLRAQVDKDQVQGHTPILSALGR